MKKRWIPWLAFAVIIGALIYTKFSKGDVSTQVTAPVKGTVMALPVDVHIAQADMLAEELAVSGTLLSAEQVQLSTEASGRVVSIHFQEGMPVAAGQLLLRLNDADLQAQLLKAQKQLELAELTEKRLKDLLKKSAVSQEEYDQASTQVQVWKSEEQLLRAQLAKMEVRAPFAGIVGLRDVSPGAYLNPGTRVATLASTGTLKLEFDLPENYASSAQVGRRLTFTTASVPGMFTATVYAIEPEINIQTRALRVRAWVPNAHGQLKPGAFVNVHMPRQKPERALMVPSQAIIPSSKGAAVFVVQADTLSTRPVSLGLRSSDMVQITSGLQPGEQVLVSGILQARPGMRVKPKILNP
ncbi:MAG: efflux RND transporter periplasmic adaptor subunit [Bacteroidetes bacterium]|nr:efflux RND transporter periplasmic adaptor subunit [Bacteroidota bacterium]